MGSARLRAFLPLSPCQVLQKLGKTVETKDEQFEQSAYNFQLQQVTEGTWKGCGWAWGAAPHHPLAPS